jgi:glycogen synthase
MKLLLYSHDWAPSIGGTQKVMYLLAEGLSAQRSTDGKPIELTLVTQTPAGNMDDGALPFRVVRRPSLVALLQLIADADVVHLAGPAFLPMLLAWGLRKKYVIQHHNYQAVCPTGSLVYNVDRSVCPNHFIHGPVTDCIRCLGTESGWLSSVWKTMLAYPRLWLCRRAAANVAVSDHAARRLSLPRTRTIYNGIEANTEAFGLVEGSEVSQRPFVAFVGRLVSDKGVGVLISAASELAEQDCEVDVRIIGDGPDRANLETLVQSLGLQEKVSFAGALRGEELERATREAIAIVMPSVWEELSPLTAIEQMLRGRLIIASDIGGLGEVVGSAGLKFAPGNASELALRIKESLTNPDLRSRLGAAAQRRAAELFRDKRMVEEHLRAYRETSNGWPR